MVVYFLGIVFSIFSGKKEIAYKLTQKISYHFRNKGRHRYRNVNIVLPYHLYFIIKEKNVNEVNALGFEGWKLSYYNLLCYDLSNEPLRHETFKILLYFCYDLNDYESCLNNAKKLKRLLEYYSDIYNDEKYEKSLEVIHHFITECQERIGQNHPRKNYDLSFVDDLMT